MKIALFGATGMVGSRIMAEALRRGHDVTAVSRSGGLFEDQDLDTVAADAHDSEAVAEIVAGHDVVASALVPPRDGDDPRERFTALYDDFLRGLRTAGTRRVVIVGGAGSLLVAPGQMLAETPTFPPDYKGEALAHHDLLTKLRGVDYIDWTYISPAPQVGPGKRTGTYRIGGDELLPDAGFISAEDYAVAFVDELENASHSRTRISVAADQHDR